MSQSNVIARERVTLVALESTFGVEPSSSFPNTPTAIIMDGTDMGVDGLAQEMLDINDERSRRMSAYQPVHGLKMASKFTGSRLLRATPSASQLTDGTSAASIPDRILLRHCVGTEFAGQGSTISGGSATTTSLPVQTGEGSRFKKGTLIAVEVSGEMEWTLITNISTDTLTGAPALSGAPADTAIVRNLYNYAPAESHSSSLSFRRAFVGDSAAQYALVGCYGGLKFSQEIGKTPAMALDLTATSYSTGALSYSTGSQAEVMGAPFVCEPSVYLSTSLARATTLVCTKFDVELPVQWEPVRDPAGVETVAAVVNTAGRPRGVKVMLSLRFDSAYETAFAADTEYEFAIVHRVGTGTTAAFWILHCPRAVLTAKPKATKVGELFYFDLELNCLEDDAVTVGSSSGTDLDFVYAPLRVAFG